MKLALMSIAGLLAMLLTVLLVGLTLSYVFIFLHFTGPESVVEKCFELGFGSGFVCALAVGFFCVSIRVDPVLFEST